MLASGTDLFPVHTMEQALKVLVRDPSNIDLIICTIAFDDSRMMDFLQAVKREPAISRIPFLCTRVVAGVLSDSSVGTVRAICTDCGAVDLLDIARLRYDAGQTALNAAVLKYAAPRN